AGVEGIDEAVEAAEPPLPVLLTRGRIGDLLVDDDELGPAVSGLETYRHPFDPRRTGVQPPRVHEFVGRCDDLELAHDRDRPAVGEPVLDSITAAHAEVDLRGRARRPGRAPPAPQLIGVRPGREHPGRSVPDEPPDLQPWRVSRGAGWASRGHGVLLLALARLFGASAST